MPWRRQWRLGERRSTGSQVKKCRPAAGRRTPRTRRPAEGLPTASERRQRMRGRGLAGGGSAGSANTGARSSGSVRERDRGGPLGARAERQRDAGSEQQQDEQRDAHRPNRGRRG